MDRRTALRHACQLVLHCTCFVLRSTGIPDRTRPDAVPLVQPRADRARAAAAVARTCHPTRTPCTWLTVGTPAASLPLAIVIDGTGVPRFHCPPPARAPTRCRGVQCNTVNHFPFAPVAWPACCAVQSIQASKFCIFFITTGTMGYVMFLGLKMVHLLME
jgi:hypothetical protein